MPLDEETAPNDETDFIELNTDESAVDGTIDPSANNFEKDEQVSVADGEGDGQAVHLDEVSPSPALEIEGVVTGEPDNGGVQSEGGHFREADANEVHIFNEGA